MGEVGDEGDDYRTKDRDTEPSLNPKTILWTKTRSLGVGTVDGRRKVRVPNGVVMTKRQELIWTSL